MYEAHFGLQGRPFSIAPDPDYLFLGRHHRNALAHLSFGIAERGGFIQLTGVVGTGKTTLTRALLRQLPDTVDMALLLNPTVTARELLIALCEELQIELPSRSHSIPALMTTLRDYLLDAFARGRHTVVLIDEAQNLSPAALEQVRMLTNLETNREKLLQIILVGQPELRSLLARPDLQQVSQRVTARYHLIPLSFAETREYIRHRLQVAGVNRPLFSYAASLVIHTRAHGIPRLINIICDRALLGAYARRRQQVSVGIALRAAAEVSGKKSRWPAAFLLGGGLTSLAALVLLGGATLFSWNGPLLEASAVEAESASKSVSAAGINLEELFRNDDPRLDSRVALQQLFALWDGHFLVGSRQTACEQARKQNLRCYTNSVDWNTLLQHNLPTVLELQGQQGANYSVLLTGFHKDTATITVGDLTLKLASSKLLSSWTGNSATLWRPPFAVKDAIVPGERSQAVSWLRRQLDLIEGRPKAIVLSDLYDPDLRKRVTSFQRDRGLAVDGIVGESTLFHLVLAAPPVDAPKLRRS